MVDINPTISIITLNMNSLNTSFKKETPLEQIKK